MELEINQWNVLKLLKALGIFFFFYFYFYLYIYPPDSQESDGGAIHRVSNLPRPASGDAKILLSASNLIEI